MNLLRNLETYFFPIVEWLSQSNGRARCHQQRYAIAFKGEIVVKRAEWIFSSGQLRVMSDNKEYGEFTADPAQVVINGKVVWYGRDLER